MKTISLRVLAFSILFMLLTLGRSMIHDNNPLHRLPYALFVSLLAALAALLYFMRFRLRQTWLYTGVVYFFAFILASGVVAIARHF